MHISKELTKEEFSKLLQDAKQGNSDAQYYVGIAYRNGWGTRKNLHKAFLFITRAIVQGNAKAQTTLGNMFASGDFVDMDYDCAMTWYKKGCDNGDKDAAALISNLYMHMADEITDQISDLSLKMLKYKEYSMLWLMKGIEENVVDCQGTFKESWEDFENQFESFHSCGDESDEDEDEDE